MNTPSNPPLPIDAVLPALRGHLQVRDEVVLEAPPGAGKTTRVPLALRHEPWLQGRRILMLEPRRLAARGAAERMAELLGEAVGASVGYRVRMDSRVGPDSVIEVVTEGVLTRMLQDDPALEDVGLLIFDEFHERSLDADLGLALALQGRELFGDLRPQPLKLLLMSATLDAAASARLLTDGKGRAAPAVTSEGHLYPVDVRYGAPWDARQDSVARVVDTVLTALAEEDGSLLVFLPGQGEIRAAAAALEAHLAERSDLLITPLYGDLDLAQQRRAIAAPEPGRRKITLATSIAETSLTIEGVRVVVDSGLARLPAFDPNTGMSRLYTRQVSRAAATQRAGRAGRLQPGVCYRLWSESQQPQLAAYTPAEILQADLAPMALQLLRWGVDDPAELRWLDPPPAAAWQQALELLQRLGGASRSDDGSWRLTRHGEGMARLPLHPRLAHLLLRGHQWRLDDVASDLAALLSERDPLPTAGADIHLRLDLLRGRQRPPRGRQQGIQRLRQQAHHYRRLLTAQPVNGDGLAIDEESACGLLLACAYPDRIAQRRDPDNNNSQYQLSNGRAAVFTSPDSLQRQPWLVVAAAVSHRERASERIALAAALDPTLFDGPLQDDVTIRTRVEWDARSERLLAEQQHRVGALLLARKPLTRMDPQQRQATLLALLRSRGLTLLPWNDELQQWRQRVLLLRRLHEQECGDADNPWPDVSDAGLLDSLEQWLGPWLGEIQQLQDWQRLDLKALLHNLLPWPLPQQLDELAPPRFSVPSGSRLAIDYSHNPPVLAVRLQEMFGCQTTPTIARGRVALVVHLLSPARRPIQVTQDLAGFWHSSYLEVKKEMRGRYPKHQWPDDPLQATATARTTKPRKT